MLEVAGKLRTVHRQAHQIIITNEKGRLLRTEHDRMVQKVEKFCAESESNKAKIEAKNGLGVAEDKRKGGDKEKIEAAVQETLDWLEENQLASGYH